MVLPRIAIIDPVGLKAGLDHYDLSLAKAMINNSASVKVYSNFSSAQDYGFIENHFSFSFYKNIFQSSSLIIGYLTAFLKARKEKSEIVILHIFHFHVADLFILWLARLIGFKTCIIVHDPENLGINRTAYIRRCLKLSDYIIVHNQFAADQLNESQGVENNNKVHVIPHGNFLDLPPNENRNAAFRYFNLDNKRKHILFFGMLKKSKGLDVLIHAMKNVDSGIDLIIAGRERDVSYKEYQSMINKLNLTNRIHSFIRYFSNSERNLLFSLSDLIVLPYRKIFQSGVLLMAMSRGLPVIVSDIPGNTEIISGNNGILFSAGDAGELANKINLLAGDDHLRNSISENALSYVRKYHNWNQIGKSFIKIFTHG